MLLRNVHWYSDGRDGNGDIRIKNGRVEEIACGLAARFREPVLDLSDCLALPGLINPHDHLDFNLLPIPGHPPYPNFVNYAKDIYRPNESPIKEMLNIPVRDRLLWGGYKNLISGVTTVCHHNPSHRILGQGFPVRVAKEVAWSHSLTYSKDLVKDFRHAGKRPFVIHAAEGIDESARQEIRKLQHLGLLQENTILVHAVAIGHGEIKLLQDSRAAVIWCPSSNLNLFGKTTPVADLLGRVPVALGTDSLLTGQATMFDELRTAREAGLATAEEILNMVTTTAAKVLRLPPGAGRLRPGSRADIVVVPDRGHSVAETLVQSRPADLKLVLIEGHIRLADSSVNSLKPNAVVDGIPKFLTGNIRRLKRRIVNKIGDGGEEIVQSSLWHILQGI